MSLMLVCVCVQAYTLNTSWACCLFPHSVEQFGFDCVSLGCIACSSLTPMWSCTHIKTHIALAWQPKGHETSWIENEASPLLNPCLHLHERMPAPGFWLAHSNSALLRRCCLFLICHAQHHCCLSMHGGDGLILSNPTITVWSLLSMGDSLCVLQPSKVIIKRKGEEMPCSGFVYKS